MESAHFHGRRIKVRRKDSDGKNDSGTTWTPTRHAHCCHHGFDLTTTTPTMLPKEETLTKFLRLLKALEQNRNKLVGIQQMQEFTGLLEFVSRFTELGLIPASAAHACLRVPLRMKAPLCPVSGLLIDESKKIRDALMRPHGVHVINDPCVLKFGKHVFTSDARGLAGDMQGGWGICVAGRCASELWSPLILKALEDEVFDRLARAAYKSAGPPLPIM